MQDLVGVGVADAAEDARVGERALERVVLATEAAANCGARRLAAARARRDRARRAPPARAPRASEARFFDDASVRISVPVGKSKAARPTLPGILAPRAGLPLEPPGDHQVQDEEQVVLEHEDDALAQPLERDDPLAVDGGERRLDRAQQERARQPHLVERLADHAVGDALDVDGDVGQLGHAPTGV